jgi:hypothetical protein
MVLFIEPFMRLLIIEPFIEPLMPPARYGVWKVPKLLKLLFKLLLKPCTGAGVPWLMEDWFTD